VWIAPNKLCKKISAFVSDEILLNLRWKDFNKQITFTVKKKKIKSIETFTWHRFGFGVVLHLGRLITIQRIRSKATAEMQYRTKLRDKLTTPNPNCFSIYRVSWEILKCSITLLYSSLNFNHFLLIIKNGRLFII
jgi:hypothetical protein